MNPMIERVARALCRQEWDKEAAEDSPARDWSTFPEYWKDAARTAIEAMREPTYEITRAMAESKARDDEGDFLPMLDLLDFSGENKTHTVLRAAYTAAIGEALK